MLKSCTYNVSEIDPCSQFHQHFMSSFMWIFFYKKNNSQIVIRKKAVRNSFVQKNARKMLVKFRPAG